MAIRPHALALTTGLASLTLHAASAQEPNVEATVLNPIIVQAPNTWDANAGAADRADSILIGPESLERRDPQTLKEVFSGESAISVGGAMPAAQKVYVNGIEETNLAVTVDGARQNRKIFHHSTTNLIDPGLLKAVRVDPGVTAADSGPGAIAGAIAYETVDAGDLLAPGENSGGFATARYATNGQTFIGGLAAYGRHEGFEGLGYVRYGDGQDYENGNGDTVEGTSTDLLSLLAKGAWTSDTGHRFELSGQQITDDADRPFRANIGSIIGRTEPVVRKYDLTSRNVVFSYEAPQTNGVWQPSALLAWSEATTDVPEPYGSKGTAGGWSGKIENLFVLGSQGTITGGADFYSEHSDYSDDYTSKVTEKAENIGLYAQARLQPLDPLRISFGLRGDYQKFEGVDGSKTDNSGLSGNASAQYDVTETVSVQAGYSSVFGGISLQEPYIFDPAWTYEDVEPVRSQNIDAGITYENAGLTLGAGLFRTDVDNARDARYGVGPYIPFDYRSEGFRLDVGYAWASGFVSANYINAKLTSDDEAVDSDTLTYFGVPVGQVIALELAQRMDRYGVVFGGTLETTLDNDDLTDLGYESIDDYTVADIYAQYQPAEMERLSLRLEINNLFDATYADRATYGQEFGSVEPLYEPGRSVALSAKWLF